jgi:iron(III) transport system ATP-binding protein
MLTARGLRKSFADTAVLRGLDLQVSAGTLTAVLGPSGCGKTTLLRLLAGFEAADDGEIRLGDRVLRDEKVHLPPERRGIGYLAQEGALFPNLDVAANVGFGLPRAVRRGGRIAELLHLVGLAGMERRLPHQLSGGQQQRVALARALAPEPAVLLLDEPFDALDAGLRAGLRAAVRAALRETGATALLVTHDQEEALSLADEVAVMRDGRIVQAGAPRQLYTEPADLEVALFLGDAVVLAAELRDGRAETALGTLAIGDREGMSAGRALAVLRPEQLHCCPPGDGVAAEGRVVATEYYGHDGTARVRLDGGATEVTARCAGHRLAAVGERVAVAVEGRALLFPGADHEPAVDLEVVHAGS